MNFSFSLAADLHSKESIEWISKSKARFDLMKESGVDPEVFAEKLISSGLVLNPSMTWVSFQSKFAFAFLLRLLTCKELPPDENFFKSELAFYFPCLVDVKQTLCKKHAADAHYPELTLNELCRSHKVLSVHELKEFEYPQAGQSAKLVQMLYLHVLKAKSNGIKQAENQIFGFLYN